MQRAGRGGANARQGGVKDERKFLKKVALVGGAVWGGSLAFADQ